MSKANFQTLIEIQALQKKMESINHQIEGENRRILDLENQLKYREESYLKEKKELDEVNLILKDKEFSLLKTQGKIADAKNNQNNVVSEKQAKALREEISSLENFKSELENQFFTQLEIQENLTKNISEFESFHVGILKTIEEIKAEIKQQFDLENKELKDLKIRHDNLISTLPINYRDFYSPITKKFKSNSLTKIENGKCGACGMSVPSSICQEVETGNTLESCLNCGRMLIPHLD
jgi:predicted  nucleic acid-binding Zn-ribbon protein